MKAKKMLSVLLVTVMLMAIFAIPVSALETEVLKLSASVSEESILVNDSVELSASGSGGTAPYTYAFYYKSTETARWTCIKGFSGTDKVTLKLSEVGNYDVCIKVKDSAKTEKKQYFVVSAVNGELSSRSYLESETVYSGKPTVLKGVGIGGTAPYTYAFYYKNTNTARWKCIKGFSETDNVSFTPNDIGTYDVCIKVHDSLNTEHKKYFVLTAEKEPFNASFSASEESINLEDAVTLTGTGSGGTAPYTYAFYFKLEDTAKWTCLKGFTSKNSISFIPDKAGKYDICIKAKDSENTEKKEYFKLEVTDVSFSSESYISSSKINLGESVTLCAVGKYGKKPYKYAFYYKLSESTKWTEIQKYSSVDKAELIPDKVGKYDICIKVKDTANTVEKQYFTLETEETGVIENAQLTFTLDKNPDDDSGFEPFVYYFNEETQAFEEVESKPKVVDNTITVNLTHFSTYVLFDKFLFKNIYESPETIALWEKSAKPVNMDTMHVALVVDCSPGAENKLSDTKEVLNAIVDSIDKKYEVTIIKSTGTAQVMCNFTNDKTELRSIIDNLSTGSGASLYEGVETALNQFKNCAQAYTDIMVLISEGQDSTSIDYNKYYQPLVDKVNQQNIRVFGVSNTSENLVKTFVDGVKQNNGYYYSGFNFSWLKTGVDYAKSNIADKFIQDSNYDGIIDSYAELFNALDNTKIKYTTGAEVLVDSAYKIVSYSDFQKIFFDYNNDGLKNGEEIVILKSDSGVLKAKRKTDMFNFDTDADGLNDLLDNNPLDSRVHKFLIYETSNSDTDLKLMDFEQRPEDYRYGQKTKSDILSMPYIY